MKPRPLSDRVIIKRNETATKTAGGIIIPDTAKEKPGTGTVVAVGRGKEGEAMEVVEGDVVMFSKHAGVEIEIDGEELLIMRESEIWAVC